jgi:putative ABC transport system substrate-binding protein
VIDPEPTLAGAKSRSAAGPCHIEVCYPFHRKHRNRATAGIFILEMKRRDFITLHGGAAAAPSLLWPLAARAQAPARMRHIGLMGNLPLRPIERFRKALHDLGRVEGKNLVIEYRFAEGRDERYPAFAAELVALPVDLIVTWGTPAAFAAKRATSQIPIVLGAIGDAVNTGLVSNLARPDGNITGFIALNVELEEKRLELLKEVIPHLSRVAVLGNSLNPLNRINLDTARRAAQKLSVAIEAFEVQSSQEVRGALRAIVEARPDAVLLASDTSLLSEGKRIVDTMAASRIRPSIRFENTRMSAASSLMAPIFRSCLNEPPATSTES